VFLGQKNHAGIKVNRVQETKLFIFKIFDQTSLEGQIIVTLYVVFSFFPFISHI